MAAVSVGNNRWIENNLSNFSFVITWREKMLPRLLRQVGSMIKMLRLSQVKYSFPKVWNASFEKQIKLNCEIISFLQGQCLFWAYENIQLPSKYLHDGTLLSLQKFCAAL